MNLEIGRVNVLGLNYLALLIDSGRPPLANSIISWPACAWDRVPNTLLIKRLLDPDRFDGNCVLVNRLSTIWKKKKKRGKLTFVSHVDYGQVVSSVNMLGMDRQCSTKVALSFVHQSIPFDFSSRAS